MHASSLQVAIDTQQEGKKLKYADILFQPVPWSIQTKKVRQCI